MIPTTPNDCITPNDFPWLLTVYKALSEKTLKHNTHCILRMQSKKDLINTIQEFKVFIQKLSCTHSDLTDFHIYQHILKTASSLHIEIDRLLGALLICNLCSYILCTYLDLLTHPFANYFTQVCPPGGGGGYLLTAPFTSSYRYRQLDIHGYSLFEHKSLAERSTTKKMCNINKHIGNQNILTDVTLPINIDIALQSLIYFSNIINILLVYFIYKITSKLDSIKKGLFLVSRQSLYNIYEALYNLERYLKKRKPDYDYVHLILKILFYHDQELLISANTSLNEVLQKPHRNDATTIKAKNIKYKVHKTNCIEILYQVVSLMIEIAIMVVSYLSLSHTTYTEWLLLLQSALWATSFSLFVLH